MKKKMVKKKKIGRDEAIAKLEKGGSFNIETPEGRAARLRFIIARREERFTYRHIGKLLGITTERVRQLYAFAIEKGYKHAKIQ